MSGAGRLCSRARRRGAATRRAVPPGAVRSAPAGGRSRARRVPSGAVCMVADMEQDAIARAMQRLGEAAEGRAEPAAFDSALERARTAVEALAATTAELETGLPEAI